MQPSQHINMNETVQSTGKPKHIFRASRKQRVIAGIICITLSAFFFFFAIAAYKDVDMGSRLGRCGFKIMYGIPCPTCGYTTATLAFARGRVISAFYIQPACAFFCTLFVLIDILSFIIAVLGINFRFISKFFTEVRIHHIIFSIIVIGASGWAVTLARAIAQNK